MCQKKFVRVNPGRGVGNPPPENIRVRIVVSCLLKNFCPKIEKLNLYHCNGLNGAIHVNTRIQAGAELCQAWSCLVGFEIRFEQN